MKAKEKEKFKKIILIPVLIISLAVFNFHLTAVFAEGEETPPAPTEQTAPPEQPAATTIETGDAAAVVEDANQVNTNVTNLEETVPPAESPADGTSTIEATTTTIGGDLEVENTNAAAVENNLLGVAETGGNSIEGSGQSIIKTGQGNVVIGLLNTVNSNFTGSEFSRFLYNIFGNSEGNIDLLDKIIEILY
jgi:cytoskeletal protein RodZ